MHLIKILLAASEECVAYCIRRRTTIKKRSGVRGQKADGSKSKK
jgi:hypothetical protein